MLINMYYIWGAGNGPEVAFYIPGVNLPSYSWRPGSSGGGGL